MWRNRGSRAIPGIINFKTTQLNHYMLCIPMSTDHTEEALKNTNKKNRFHSLTKMTQIFADINIESRRYFFINHRKHGYTRKGKV
jgi:hypothetical protein